VFCDFVHFHFYQFVVIVLSFFFCLSCSCFWDFVILPIVHERIRAAAARERNLRLIRIKFTWSAIQLAVLCTQKQFFKHISCFLSSKSRPKVLLGTQNSQLESASGYLAQATFFLYLPSIRATESPSSQISIVFYIFNYNFPMSFPDSKCHGFQRIIQNNQKNKTAKLNQTNYANKLQTQTPL
jgi:hypothetical protein